MIGRAMPLGPVVDDGSALSGAGTTGAGVPPHHGSASASRRPSVRVASTRALPSCTSRARTWLIPRPRRSTSLWTSAGPSPGGATYVEVAARGWGWAGPSTAAAASAAARARMASR